ncbi:hypothetical protein GQ473_02045 [archaeon]|nr:hypothetical protein [archaeon]
MTNPKIKLEISVFLPNDRVIVIEPGASCPIEIQEGTRFTSDELNHICRIANTVSAW